MQPACGAAVAEVRRGGVGENRRARRRQSVLVRAARRWRSDGTSGSGSNSRVTRSSLPSLALNTHTHTHTPASTVDLISYHYLFFFCYCSCFLWSGKHKNNRTVSEGMILSLSFTLASACHAYSSSRSVRHHGSACLSLLPTSDLLVPQNLNLARRAARV